MDNLVENLPEYWEIVAQIIAVLAAIAAITPTRLDDQLHGKVAKAYNTVSRVVNIGALNVGKAKNADDK